MDLADFVRLARVVQDTLGRGGFAGIDVSHDAKVTGEIQGRLPLPLSLTPYQR